jgi:ABC-type microcin C transport system permease subunit YejE
VQKGVEVLVSVLMLPVLQHWFGHDDDGKDAFQRYEVRKQFGILLWAYWRVLMGSLFGSVCVHYSAVMGLYGVLRPGYIIISERWKRVAA